MIWSKQYLLAKFSNFLDENGGPLPYMRVFGNPYSQNTFFRVPTVALVVVLRTFLTTGNLL